MAHPEATTEPGPKRIEWPWVVSAIAHVGDLWPLLEPPIEMIFIRYDAGLQAGIENRFNELVVSHDQA